MVAEDGQVQLNKNVVNGSEPMLRLIGDLPSGTPVAFEAAFGWGRLVQVLEDYGFEAPGAPAAVQGHRLGAAEERQGPAPRSWRSCCAQTCCPRRGVAPVQVRQLRALLRHRASLVRLGTSLRNRIHAVAADHGYDRSASY